MIDLTNIVESYSWLPCNRRKDYIAGDIVRLRAGVRSSALKRGAEYLVNRTDHAFVRVLNIDGSLLRDDHRSDFGTNANKLERRINKI